VNATAHLAINCSSISMLAVTQSIQYRLTWTRTVVVASLFRKMQAEKWIVEVEEVHGF
jgi:hypothetical protein